MCRVAVLFAVSCLIAACRPPPVEHRAENRSPGEMQKGSDGVCRYRPPQVGRSGASGVAPIYEVECPPDLGGPPIGARPKGRETWLRMRPWLQLQWANNKPNQCRMIGEAFCPRPLIEAPCDHGDERIVTCSLVGTEAGADSHFHVESFVWTDAAGRCHRVTA